MKVSEKSLELNVGAELLGVLRWRWRMRKAYLHGLTQREERQVGVDFFVELPSSTLIFAFQFKAPKGQWGDRTPYRFTIQRHQHDKLSQLASGWPGSVYYVLPFYVLPAKLWRDVPCLLRDTWFLPVAAMLGTNVFGDHKTRTMRCRPGVASINPDYELLTALQIDLGPDAGIPVRQFAEWYADLHDENDESVGGSLPRAPWPVRGLRIAIVQPELTGR